MNSNIHLNAFKKHRSGAEKNSNLSNDLKIFFSVNIINRTTKVC